MVEASWKYIFMVKEKKFLAWLNMEIQRKECIENSYEVLHLVFITDNDAISKD